MLRRLWTKARSTELARYSTLLFAALTFANFSNYLFHVVISRMLGPAAYGALGALLSAFIVISVPAGAAGSRRKAPLDLPRDTTSGDEFFAALGFGYRSQGTPCFVLPL